MASEFQRSLEFIELAEASSTLGELQQALSRVLDEFGVPHYTLGAMLPDHAGASPKFTTLIRGTTQAWSDYYWDQKLFNADAAVHLALQRASAFSWSEVEARRLPTTSVQLFDDIRDALHIKGGFVIPVHDAYSFSGIIALHHDDRELTTKAAHALKLISIYGIERAKELYENSRRPLAAPQPCPLSERQREILAYAAAGKSEADTGDILGIAGVTVREHIEKTRNLLGVRTKMQAVALAVGRGWIAP